MATGRQACKQTRKHTRKHTGGHTCGHTGGHTGKHTGRQAWGQKTTNNQARAIMDLMAFERDLDTVFILIFVADVLLARVPVRDRLELPPLCTYV